LLVVDATRGWRLAGVLALSIVSAGAVPPAAPPRVRLIATGGTIANARDGRWTADMLAASAPGVARIAELEPETFSRGPSLSLSLDDWLRLSRRVAEVASDPGIAGIVVTTGTDTLEELSWFLDLTVRSRTPVIVTGAIRKPGESDSDGPSNLADAVRVAISPLSRQRGTLVVFHGSIFDARDVEKISTSKSDAFASLSHGRIGQLIGDRVTFTGEARRRHGPSSEFDIAHLTQLPRVDVLLTYQGAPGDLAEAALGKGARGLVMAAAGAGALSIGEISAVNAALRAGVPVVIASRVDDGRVSLVEGGAEQGLIAGGDLAPVKARILLMLGIASGLNPQGLERLFREY
jgi:L-asparaginase